MHADVVKSWFGEQFNNLHPLLQELHVGGGQLSGDVRISFGTGMAGLIGRRLAKKMRFPGPGTHQLRITISHDIDGLFWKRSFNNQTPVTSLFKAVGNIESGYWLESTGPLEMKLTVDVVDGGWYWRCLSVRFLGMPVPKWLMPHTDAYKTIADDLYRFHVEFSLPIIGPLVSYEGLLELEKPQ
ncbi:DUF4166 domain-containing protein [Pseudomonas sp. GD03944]|uniref:DUF4166 domain-containing protein n=1 Tax=Pseudomonas sp. GD03944 TaxID=2975409 RepID=UPI002447F654|nr:DUF4166 domain-containing protein [Pseudomonas sp. GD03944]MDH1261969.1 DUF4166 domain-containing protein [Pseudomonas sp. GD03944]